MENLSYYCRLLAVALPLQLLLVACYGDSMEVGQRIFVPDTWNPPEITGSKGAQVVKPASPGSYKEEKTGASLGVKSVTVHGGPGRVKIHKLTKAIEVQLEDGTILTVTRGRDVTIDKQKYKVLGTADGYLYLQSRKTKAIWRFKGIPKSEAKVNGKDEDPTTWQFMVH